MAGSCRRSYFQSMILLIPLTACLSIVGVIVMLFCVYTLLFCGRIKKPTSPPKESKVSVIIPFRNEAHNLGMLLTSLKNQNYEGPFDIVLVNDGSTDSWHEVVSPFQSLLNIILVDSCYDETKSNLSRKQHALDVGVSASVGRYLLFTDADMVLSVSWIFELVDSAVSMGVACVFGHTTIIQSQNSFRKRCEAYQLEILFTLAYVCSRLGIPGSCMGNNLLVSRTTYVACGGQKGLGYSIVEDYDFLQLLHKKGFKSAACEPFTSTAQTYPCTTLRQYYNQLLRWAMGGLRPSSKLFWMGMCALAVAFSGVFLAMSASSTMLWVLPAVFGISFVAVSIIALTNADAKIPWWFLPIYPVLLSIECLALLGALIVGVRPVWKQTRLVE